MASTVLDAGVAEAAGRVSDLFARLHRTLSGWREAILEDLEAASSPALLDERVAGLVLPPLREPDPLLIGAGFVAAPEFAGGSDLHFSWWLGPLQDNPIFGATTAPSRLDLASRSYAGYLRDLDSLEWYSIPRRTRRTHITGPYIDQLCACDYIVTVTSPVESADGMIGVVGVDVYVKRLERELLPSLLASGRGLALVNASGRVLVSTDPSVRVGSVFPVPEDAVACPGTTFHLVPTVRAERAG